MTDARVKPTDDRACDCPVCGALLELAASALRTRAETDARRTRLRVLRWKDRA